MKTTAKQKKDLSDNIDKIEKEKQTELTDEQKDASKWFESFVIGKPLPEINKKKIDKDGVYRINTNDERFNYKIGSKGEIEDLKNLANKNEVDYSCIDYSFCEKNEAENPNVLIDETQKQSFQQIDNPYDGELWYRNNFPEIPEILYPVMARWNWGDLKSHTAKSLKQEEKNKKRKEAKKNQKGDSGFKNTKGNFVVKFE